MWLDAGFTQFWQPLSQPDGSSPLFPAASWLGSLLTGSLATLVAVLAVGTTGLLMLDGRLEPRRGGKVIIGCFVLFGAPTIALGLRGLVREEVPLTPARAIESLLPASQTYSNKPSTRFDPAAGAAVPTNGRSWTGLPEHP